MVCFSLAVLLGLSWSLGYLVLVSKHHANTVLSIIFCICQTTQVSDSSNSSPIKFLLFFFSLIGFILYIKFQPPIFKRKKMCVYAYTCNMFLFALFLQGVQIFIFFTARTPTFRAAMKHCGQTINSAFFARVQTYHLWKNFKKALSFESYRNWDSGRTGCPNTIDTNTSSQ